MDDQIEKFFGFIVFFLFIIIGLSIAPQFAGTLASTTTTEEESPPLEYGEYLNFGISSRPTTWGSDTDYNLTSLQEVIDYLDNNNLTVYRMCFAYDADFADVRTFVDYYLGNTDKDLVINYYHQYPPGAMGSWADTTQRSLWLCGNYSAYFDRIYLEPINERTDTDDDLVADCQTYADTLTAAGYSDCQVVVNRWYTQDWNVLATLNYTNWYWGEHHYFDQETAVQAMLKEEDAYDLSLKLLDTEVGADINEYPEFTDIKVGSVNSYLQWCSTHNVTACVWMLHGTRNAATYTGLGLVYPN